MRDSTWLLVFTVLSGVAVQVHVSELIDAHASHLQTSAATPSPPVAAKVMLLEFPTSLN